MVGTKTGFNGAGDIKKGRPFPSRPPLGDDQPRLLRFASLALMAVAQEPEPSTWSVEPHEVLKGSLAEAIARGEAVLLWRG